MRVSVFAAVLKLAGCPAVSCNPRFPVSCLSRVAAAPDRFVLLSSSGGSDAIAGVDAANP